MFVRLYSPRLKCKVSDFFTNFVCYTQSIFGLKAVITIVLLVISNVFMTFAWYGNLKLQQMGLIKNWPLIGVILLSWGIAFLEYCFMVPANRIGFRENGGPFSLFELKIIQEAITLTVFTIVATLMFRHETLRWNHVAAFICIMAAVAFAFLPTKT